MRGKNGQRMLKGKRLTLGSAAIWTDVEAEALKAHLGPFNALFYFTIERTIILWPLLLSNSMVDLSCLDHWWVKKGGSASNWEFEKRTNQGKVNEVQELLSSMEQLVQLWIVNWTVLPHIWKMCTVKIKVQFHFCMSDCSGIDNASLSPMQSSKDLPAVSCTDKYERFWCQFFSVKV